MQPAHLIPTVALGIGAPRRRLRRLRATPRPSGDIGRSAGPHRTGRPARRAHRVPALPRRRADPRRGLHRQARRQGREADHDPPAGYVDDQPDWSPDGQHDRLRTLQRRRSHARSARSPPTAGSRARCRVRCHLSRSATPARRRGCPTAASSSTSPKAASAHHGELGQIQQFSVELIDLARRTQRTIIKRTAWRGDTHTPAASPDGRTVVYKRWNSWRTKPVERPGPLRGHMWTARTTTASRRGSSAPATTPDSRPTARRSSSARSRSRRASSPTSAPCDPDGSGLAQLTHFKPGTLVLPGLVLARRHVDRPRDRRHRRPTPTSSSCAPTAAATSPSRARSSGTAPRTGDRPAPEHRAATERPRPMGPLDHRSTAPPPRGHPGSPAPTRRRQESRQKSSRTPLRPVLAQLRVLDLRSLRPRCGTSTASLVATTDRYERKAHTSGLRETLADCPQ